MWVSNPPRFFIEISEDFESACNTILNQNAQDVPKSQEKLDYHTVKKVNLASFKNKISKNHKGVNIF